MPLPGPPTPPDCFADVRAPYTAPPLPSSPSADHGGDDYVDSHGQSEIGFGLTRLLGYDLLPRIKQINKVKLYRPGREDEDNYERLTDAMTRPIHWDVIENNYDQLIKYATAIRVGTASTEAILRRFTRTASHPVY